MPMVQPACHAVAAALSNERQLLHESSNVSAYHQHQFLRFLCVLMNLNFASVQRNQSCASLVSALVGARPCPRPPVTAHVFGGPSASALSGLACLPDAAVQLGGYQPCASLPAPSCTPAAALLRCSQAITLQRQGRTSQRRNSAARHVSSSWGGDAWGRPGGGSGGRGAARR